MTRTFLTVSLPLAVPGIVASALLVFLYSLDEFTGTLLVGAPFVTTLPVYMYTASVGYELQIASVTAIVLMVPGALLLLLLERVLKAEYLVFFGQVERPLTLPSPPPGARAPTHPLPSGERAG